MTTKRDSKSKPKKERPKIKKETLKDLTPGKQAEEARGGAIKGASDLTRCPACMVD